MNIDITMARLQRVNKLQNKKHENSKNDTYRSYKKMIEMKMSIKLFAHDSIATISNNETFVMVIRA